MNKRYLTLVGLVVGALLLGGCAAAASQPAASQGTAPGAAGTQTDTPSDAQAGTHAGAAQAAGTPPAAAAMVCSQEAKDNVTKILALPSVPKTTQAWNGTTLSCSYALPEGNFDMSVQVFPAPQGATTGAKALAESLDATPIEGLSNLGLPGWQSGVGSVVFAKDNMVLHVDATKMSATVGAHRVPRADFAYQMATTILACWTEH